MGPALARRDAAPGRFPADSLTRAAVARDLFRLGRRPAVVVYDPVRGAAPPEEAPPAEPKPALHLVGLVDGTPPLAILEGLPGTSGSRTVRVGDVVGELRIEAITGVEVRVAGMDTLWVLKVRKAW